MQLLSSCFYFVIINFLWIWSFSALMPLVGGRKGIRPVKTWVVRYCLGYLSGVCSKVQMIHSWCHCHSIISCSSKMQNGLSFWCQRTQVVLEKRPLNGCSSSSNFFVNLTSHCKFLWNAMKLTTVIHQHLNYSIKYKIKMYNIPWIYLQLLFLTRCYWKRKWCFGFTPERRIWSFCIVTTATTNSTQFWHFFATIGMRIFRFWAAINLQL